MSDGSICTSFLLSFASVKCFLIFEGHFSSMKLAAVLTELPVYIFESVNYRRRCFVLVLRRGLLFVCVVFL